MDLGPQVINGLFVEVVGGFRPTLAFLSLSNLFSLLRFPRLIVPRTTTPSTHPPASNPSTVWVGGAPQQTRGGVAALVQSLASPHIVLPEVRYTSRIVQIRNFEVYIIL